MVIFESGAASAICEKPEITNIEENSIRNKTKNLFFNHYRPIKFPKDRDIKNIHCHIFLLHNGFEVDKDEIFSKFRSL